MQQFTTAGICLTCWISYKWCHPHYNKRHNHKIWDISKYSHHKRSMTQSNVQGVRKISSRLQRHTRNKDFFMIPDKIKNIPCYITVTYTRIVVDYRPLKKDPNQVWITVDGNLINYADLVTTKILWNSTLNIPGAKTGKLDVSILSCNANG